MQINFSEIPGFSNLFLDYVYEFDNCKSFFDKHFLDSAGYEDQFKARITPDDTIRLKMREIIAEQYSKRNPSKVTIQNINAIANENTISVISEIHPYLLGGPLSIIYKIISSVKLSQKLNEEFDRFNFIPVAWIESENVDIAEVTRLSFLTDDNSLVNLRYDTEFDESENDISAGSLQLEKGIIPLVETVEKSTDSVFIQKLLGKYRPGFTVQEAFTDFIFRLFDEYGVVLFIPTDKKTKRLLAPLFRQELINFREHAEKLVETTAALDESYEAYEKLTPLNLYMNIDNKRFSIEPVDNQFRLHTKRKRISEEEILSIIKDEPEKISPGALLLPICQNYLFQTGFRITDSSEINRLAQCNPLHNFYGIEPPFIYPTISATLLDEKINDMMEKLNFTLSQIFFSDNPSENGGDDFGDNSVDELIAKAKVDIAEILAELEEQLDLTDNPSKDYMRETAKQTAILLEALREKIKLSKKKRALQSNFHLEEIKKFLYPNRCLQENEIASLSFLRKYDAEFLKILFSQLKVGKFEHQIIRL